MYRTKRKHNNLIIIRSLSKIGLAALRIGYAVADPVIIDQINKVRLPYNSNAISQSIAELLITHFDPVQEQINFIIEERKRLINIIKEINSITIFPSDSNFFLFRTQESADKMFQYLIEHGILVRNLNLHPKLKNCMRVTVGTRDENDQFTQKLMAFIKLGS